MQWVLDVLYERIGVQYPRASLVFATLLGAILGGLLLGGGWWLLGVRYTKVYVQTTVAPTQKPKGSEQYEPVLKKAALDKATLDQARQALDKIEGEFSPQELAQAYEGLAKGDPSKAETLFQRILAVSGSTVSLVGSREKAFSAAFILAELAEGHGDYQAASRYNKQARELKPSGDTVQGHGFVGDDTPKVIFALKTIPGSRRTIIGIHEATGIDQSIIKQRLHSLELGGFAVKSETDSPYWSLTPKGEKAFADLK